MSVGAEGWIDPVPKTGSPLKWCTEGADALAVERKVPPMTRSLKLSAIVTLVAYVSGATALLWRR
jgi:hypothetical protein